MSSPVCLIIPPSAFLLDERVFLSLGILKVAAALEARGRSVEVLDLSGVANYEVAAAQHAMQSSARWFAITATTPQMPAAASVAKVIRYARPEISLIIGGPHPTVTLAAYKKENAAGKHGRAARALHQLQLIFDAVVAGDGEDAIEQALMVDRRATDEAYGSIIDADDPRGPLFLTPKRLEATPWPARHLVDLDSYRYTIDGVRATTLVAQLGCPFGCTFCGGRASPMLRRARMRSTESVLAEIEHLHTRYGYCGFMLYDDELNVNPKVVELMKGIAALQRKHGAEFRLRGFVKAELFTQEQADVMREAGFRWLLCGFESGSPRILDNINKRADVADNDRAVEYARKAGLKVKALMSIGHAGESPLTIAETKAWLLSTRPDDFDCTIITPYPGSPYYDEAVQLFAQPLGGRCGEVFDGLDGHLGCNRHRRHGDDHYRHTMDGDPIEHFWTYTAPRTGDRLHMRELDYSKEADYYKGKPGGGYVSHVWTPEVSRELLVELRDELENSVRAALGIPFNAGQPGVQFEASMGQTPGRLPPSILRTSEK